MAFPCTYGGKHVLRFPSIRRIASWEIILYKDCEQNFKLDKERLYACLVRSRLHYAQRGMYAQVIYRIEAKREREWNKNPELAHDILLPGAKDKMAPLPNDTEASVLQKRGGGGVQREDLPYSCCLKQLVPSGRVGPAKASWEQWVLIWDISPCSSALCEQRTVNLFTLEEGRVFCGAAKEKEKKHASEH